MRLKNILLVVKDIEASKQFYQNYFGMQIIRDFSDNVILTEGLVLQEQKKWEQLVGEGAVIGNGTELFFVEDDLDAFISMIKDYMEKSGQNLQMRENSWGKRAILLKDPDGHMIEVAER